MWCGFCEYQYTNGKKNLILVFAIELFLDVSLDNGLSDLVTQDARRHAGRSILSRCTQVLHAGRNRLRITVRKLQVVWENRDVRQVG